MLLRFCEIQLRIGEPVFSRRLRERWQSSNTTQLPSCDYSQVAVRQSNLYSLNSSIREMLTPEALRHLETSILFGAAHFDLQVFTQELVRRGRATSDRRK